MNTINLTEKRLAALLIGGLMTAMAVASIAGFNMYQPSVPHADSGFLDLSGWDFQRSGNLKLDGEWEFYWNKFLYYHDFRNEAPDIYGSVPATWSTYSIKDSKLPGQGYGTYRLRVKTDLEPGTIMGFQLGTFSSAYRIYVNNLEVAAGGAVAAEPSLSSPEFRPQAVEFRVPANDFEIVVQVSNYHHGRGGFWYSLVLGSGEGINTLSNKLENRQIIIFCILVFMMLINFSLFVLRRQAREYLYLALLAFTLLIVSDTTNQFYIYRIFPQISFHWLVFFWYGSASWACALLVLFTEAIFPDRYSKQLVRIWIVYTSALTLLFIVVPVSFYTRFVQFLNIFNLVPLLYVMYLTIRAVNRNERGSGLYLFVFSAAVFTSVHDTLFLNNIIRSRSGELTYIGIAALFFTQTIIQAQRYTTLFQVRSKLLEKLHLVNELKDEFMQNTSHQVRLPLNAIETLSEDLLEESVGTLNARQSEYLTLIRAFAEKAGNLANDILIYSKLKHGEITANYETVNLKVVADNVLDVLGKVYSNSSVLLDSAYPDNLPPVYADESHLYQIIYNLVDNGIKSALNGKVELSVRLVEDVVQVRIADSGPGIPPGRINSVFEFFDDAAGTPARNNACTGLSLPIARQLIELYGGAIWIEETEAGQGITFTLPAAQGEPKECKTHQMSWGQNWTRLATTPSPKQGPHILMVDDSLVFLSATARLLEHFGYAVTTVSDSNGVVERICSDPSISAVLIDVIMPGKSGYDICREIRKFKTPFDLPILILTANTAIKNVVMGFDAGANDYLIKPFNKEELLARVRTLVNLKESVDKAITSEVSFLQAQIKPHFLYNALSVIASMITISPQEARTLIVNLSAYLRNSFDFINSDDMIPLYEEIALVLAYVDIESARFGSRLEFHLVVEEIPEATVPRLVLQPLVENAIRHGIFSIPNGGRVQLIIQPTPDQLHFSVVDNGVGMAREQVDSILTGSHSQGVGLANINKRLMRYFGKRLHIESEPGSGTTVTFSVPFSN